jgi:hypothetical protein
MSYAGENIFVKFANTEKSVRALFRLVITIANQFSELPTAYCLLPTTYSTLPQQVKKIFHLHRVFFAQKPD